MNTLHCSINMYTFNNRTLNDIIKRNCEECLFKIFELNIKVLFKKDKHKEDFLYKCVKYDNRNFLKIILSSEYSKIFQLSINNRNIKGKNIFYEAVLNLNKSSFEGTNDTRIIRTNTNISGTTSDTTSTESLELLILGCNNIDYNSDYYLHLILNTVTDSRKIIKYLKLLIDNHLVDPKQKDFNNNTLLHIFFKREWGSSYQFSNNLFIFNVELLTYLLSLGIDPNLKNTHGETMLQLCVCSPNNEDFLKVILLSKGVSVNDLDDKKSISYAPIHHIVLGDFYEYLKILLLYRTDVNINIKSSRILHTPLHIACCSDKPNTFNIVELLLSNGCSIDEPCSAGLTPLDYAQWFKLHYVKEYILNFKISSMFTKDEEIYFYPPHVVSSITNSTITTVNGGTSTCSTNSSATAVNGGSTSDIDSSVLFDEDYNFNYECSNISYDDVECDFNYEDLFDDNTKYDFDQTLNDYI